MTTSLPMFLNPDPDWIPCNQYIPKHDQDWNIFPLDPRNEILGYHSVEVIILRASGDMNIGYAQQWYYDDPLRWFTDGEGWDITSEAVCWRPLPPKPDSETWTKWRQE